MENKSSIGFGVIGAGHIGKRHAEMISRHSEARLVALCDILDEEKLGLSKFNAPLYKNIDQLLNNEEIEVVSIASPNGIHATHALAALDAKKHVVIEKPMALKKADCERIIYKALNVHRHVFCIMQNRFSPPSVWLKQLIESQKLGKIFMVQINCYWNRDDRYYKSGSWHGSRELDGGTLFTQFSHFIDIMYWLFGDITNIKARLHDFAHQHSTEFEDSGFVNFEFVNGGLGSLNFSTAIWDKNLESSITIIAENGAVKVGGQYMNEVEYCHIKDYAMPELPPSNPANDYGHYKGSAANHHYIFENVIDVLKGRDTINTNALEGLKVVEIIERIYSANGIAYPNP